MELTIKLQMVLPLVITDFSNASLSQVLGGLFITSLTGASNLKGSVMVVSGRCI